MKVNSKMSVGGMVFIKNAVLRSTAVFGLVLFLFPGCGGGDGSSTPHSGTGTAPAVGPNTSFVAPNGNDSNPGTIGQPYLTIQKCATTVASGWTCQIRAGTYHETVTPNSGIVLTSYNGESVTIDGSDSVTGWTLHQGSIYKASANLSSGDTNQLFVGQQMMTEARWPNGDDLFHVNWATAQSGTTTTQLVDSNLPNINWTGAKIHLWSGTDPWAPQTGTITASQNGQMTFSVDGASWRTYIIPQVGGYYYLFGSLGALDTQREWFYDNNTKTLYFWAPGGANPGTLDVRAKQRQFAFDLSGKSNVTIQNLNLFACTITSDSSSTKNTISGITATYVSHFTTLPDNPGQPSSYWFDHLQDSGIVINGSGNILQNSTISYSAGNGVALLGSNNVVKNNLIHHVDYIANESAGITLFGTGQVIRNNTIWASGRYSISPSTMGIYWNTAPNNADISYNNVFNAMMLSRDGGEIYSGVPLAVTGSRIHHNWIHDTNSLYPGPADTYPLSGVYLDEASSGWEVDQNVLWNNQYHDIFLHYSTSGYTGPMTSNVHNNSMPDVGNTAYIWLQDISNCGSTQVINNLALVSVLQTNSNCNVTNNNSTAPGATEMTGPVQVGCNFAGCSSDGPPAISGGSVSASIVYSPYNLSVSAGQSATFSVIAAGSAPIGYQWRKNGVNILGATSPSYTTPAAVSSDNGAVFTVHVGNSVGSVDSASAVLTVN